jgi:hypothetical protein
VELDPLAEEVTIYDPEEPAVCDSGVPRRDGIEPYAMKSQRGHRRAGASPWLCAAAGAASGQYYGEGVPPARQPDRGNPAGPPVRPYLYLRLLPRKHMSSKDSLGFKASLVSCQFVAFLLLRHIPLCPTHLFWCTLPLMN